MCREYELIEFDLCDGSNSNSIRLFMFENENFVSSKVSMWLDIIYM